MSRTFQQNISGIDVWITIDEAFRHNDNRELEVFGNLVYFKFEPPALVYGELIRGEDGVPVTVEDDQEAIDLVTEVINERYAA